MTVYSLSAGCWKPFDGDATTRGVRLVTSQQEQKTLHAFFHQRCSRFRKRSTQMSCRPTNISPMKLRRAKRTIIKPNKCRPQDVDLRRKQNRKNWTLIRRAPLSSEFKFPIRDGLKSSCPKCGWRALRRSGTRYHTVKPIPNHGVRPRGDCIGSGLVSA